MTGSSPRCSILQSKTLLLAVADELHLYADPSIAGKSGKGNGCLRSCGPG